MIARHQNGRQTFDVVTLGYFLQVDINALLATVPTVERTRAPSRIAIPLDAAVSLMAPKRRS
ncbi:hypothetical protein [Burkholderia cepacia]|uniref:hypothetical protein n=1 Tax=Burkholderia cepacia TaxID=292 RepID=UPI002AB61099|nr:hypothetical protein [Burkholderia cepacia]